MSKLERVGLWVVTIFIGIPFVFAVSLLLISMSVTMYTELIGNEACW